LPISVIGFGRASAAIILRVMAFAAVILNVVKLTKLIDNSAKNNDKYSNLKMDLM
jgi:hypothetical protein